MNSSRAAGVIAVLATAFLWGTTGTAATFAPTVGPLAIGAASLGIGGILQAAIAAPALRRELPSLRRRPALLIVGAVAVFVYPLAFYSSMHLAGVAIGTVVSLASAPVAAGLLERILDRRTLTPRWLIAAGLGIVGGALLALAKADGGASAHSLAGVGLGLLAGASYAVYSWCVHRLLRTGVGRAASMGAVFGLGGILLLPVLIATGTPLLATSQNFAVAAYMALVPMFLGYVLFGYGLTKLPPSTVTTLTLFEPAVAAVLAVAVVGERLSPAGWSGLGLIGVALVLLTLPRRAPSSWRPRWRA